MVLAWLLFETYELYGIEHVAQHSWSWSIAGHGQSCSSQGGGYNARLTCLDTQERAKTKTNVNIYDQERSRAQLGSTNNCQDQERVFEIRVFFGVMRPGEAMQNANDNPLVRDFYQHLYEMHQSNNRTCSSKLAYFCVQ